MVYYIKLVNGNDVVAGLLNAEDSEELHLENPMQLMTQFEDESLPIYFIRWLPFLDDSEVFLSNKHVLYKHMLDDETLLSYYSNVVSKYTEASYESAFQEKGETQTIEDVEDLLNQLIDKKKTLH